MTNPYHALVDEVDTAIARAITERRVTLDEAAAMAVKLGAVLAHKAGFSRDEAIEACARAGYEVTPPCGPWNASDGPIASGWVRDAEDVLAGEEESDRAFRRAVIKEARRHPALADEPALRPTVRANGGE